MKKGRETRLEIGREQRKNKKGEKKMENRVRQWGEYSGAMQGT